MGRITMKYLTSGDLRDRYQVTDMTLLRWENDPRMAFPKPIRINQRKLWIPAEVDAWDRARRPIPSLPGAQSAA